MIVRDRAGDTAVAVIERMDGDELCSRLMQAFGLDTASCKIIEFGPRKVLAVERFDRVAPARRMDSKIAAGRLLSGIGVGEHEKV